MKRLILLNVPYDYFMENNTIKFTGENIIKMKSGDTLSIDYSTIESGEMTIKRITIEIEDENEH